MYISTVCILITLIIVSLFLKNKVAIGDRELEKLLCNKFQCKRNELFVLRETNNECTVIFNDCYYQIIISKRRPFTIVSCLEV